MPDLIPLIIGSALVGIVHMAAPDHWLTICVMGKRSAWSRSRTLGISLATASGHVVLSVVLGLAVVLVGLAFSGLASSYINAGIGWAMVIVGIFLGVRPLVASNTGSDSHEGIQADQGRTMARRAGYFVALGGALSPDLSIVPFFASAIPGGAYFAVELSATFAIASILTLLLLVQLGLSGFTRAFEKMPEKYNDSLVGFVIALVGLYLIVAG